MSDKAEEARDDRAQEAPPATREELTAQVSELEETVQTLNNLLSALSARMLRNVDDLRDEVRRRVVYADLQPFQKELDRIRARIDDIVDEVGYGEALDIAKVPPSILEAAYQGILDDVVAELKKVRGVHDAELHILHSLEQLRLKTSGSDLFLYKPHRLHVGVAKALGKGLVSARQVQMTYEELLRHLLEPIHYHTPKNFRALIKIKSQEYSVDKALTLATAWEGAGPQLQTLQERVDRLEEQVRGALRDVQDFAARIQETLAGVATRESVEALGMRLVALEGRSRESPPAAEPPPKEQVLAALGEPLTLAALRKATGLSEAAAKEALAELERDGLISSSVKGRHTVYERKEEREHA
ncbi:MAG: hypothetical protein AABY30_01050 [Candidatus Thermoplasmatota archaeon]